MVSICAWCERFLGLKEPSTDPTITHGICRACAARQTWQEQPVLVVSRDRHHLVPVLEELLRGRPEIRVVVDRRRGEARRPRDASEAERREGPVRRGDELFLV